MNYRAEITARGETLEDLGAAIDRARSQIVDGEYLAASDSSDNSSYSFDVHEPEPVGEEPA